MWYQPKECPMENTSTMNMQLFRVGSAAVVPSLIKGVRLKKGVKVWKLWRSHDVMGSSCLVLLVTKRDRWLSRRVMYEHY